MQRRLLDNHLASLMNRCGRKVSNRLSADLRSVGLSLDAWLVLHLLVTEGAKSMSEIAEELVLNLTTATKLIDRMVSDNLVYRKPGETDRRVVNILPSDAGVIRHQVARKIVEREQVYLKKTLKNVDDLMDRLLQVMASIDGTNK